jgi:hypothetical protein
VVVVLASGLVGGLVGGLLVGIAFGLAFGPWGNAPVDSNCQRAGRVLTAPPGRGPAAKATLTSVIFAGGHFVGSDERGALERLGQQIKTVREVGILAKTGAWDQLDALALSPGSRSGPPPSGEDPRTYFERRSIATRLVQEWKFKGDAAAKQLAEIYSALPALWK